MPESPEAFDLTSIDGYNWTCEERTDRDGEVFFTFVPREKPTHGYDDKFPALELYSLAVVQKELASLDQAFAAAMQRAPTKAGLPNNQTLSQALGFSCQIIGESYEKNGEIVIPETSTLKKRWDEIVKPRLPMAKLFVVQSVPGIATDIDFATACTEPSVVCSTGAEKIHDYFNHLIPEMHRILNAFTAAEYNRRKAGLINELKDGLARLEAYKAKADSLPSGKRLTNEEIKLLEFSLGYHADITTAEKKWPEQGDQPETRGIPLRTAVYREGELGEDALKACLKRRNFSEKTLDAPTIATAHAWDRLWALTAEESQKRPSAVSLKALIPIFKESFCPFSRGFLVIGETLVLDSEISGAEPYQFKVTFLTTGQGRDETVKRSEIHLEGQHKIYVSGDIRTMIKLPNEGPFPIKTRLLEHGKDRKQEKEEALLIPKLRSYLKKRFFSYLLIKLGLDRAVKFFSPLRYAKVKKTTAFLQQLADPAERAFIRKQDELATENQAPARHLITLETYKAEINQAVAKKSSSLTRCCFLSRASKAPLFSGKKTQRDGTKTSSTTPGQWEKIFAGTSP